VAVAGRVVVYPMTRKIILIVAGVLLAGGLAFGGMMLFREKLDYAGASAYVDDMLVMEISIREFLDAEIDVYDDGAEELAARFIELTKRMSEYYKSLGASSALKNSKVKEKYDELAGTMGSLEEVRAVAKWLVGFIETGEAGEEAPNEFTVGMAGDMADWLQKVKAFKEKYAGGKADSYCEMTEEYGIIMVEGEELKGKYEGVTLMDVAGVSVDDIKGWFDGLKQLADILEAKK